ncbi:MAG: iron-sulfur cluster assembly scaffold protein [Myxococcota bacterium]
MSDDPQSSSAPRSVEALYQDAILSWARDGRRTGPLPSPPQDGDRKTRKVNPLCGDRCTVSVRGSAARLEMVRTESRGCAISLASAALMAELVEGLPPSEATALFGALRAGLEGSTDAALPEPLRPLLSVRPFRSRHRCALLPWEALSELIGLDTWSST